MKTKECAINFIKTLSIQDKKKLKKMLDHGVMCCVGYAKKNDVDPISLNRELRSLLGGE